jgi:hypothetical protein
MNSPDFLSLQPQYAPQNSILLYYNIFSGRIAIGKCVFREKTVKIVEIYRGKGNAKNAEEEE